MTKTDAPTNENTITVEQALKQAITLHQAGRLQDAERIYLTILKAQPRHPVANHNMGLLARQRKNHALSLSYFKIAYAINPNQQQYWLSYINALIQTHQLASAREILAQGGKRGIKGAAFDAMTKRLELEIRKSISPSLKSFTLKTDNPKTDKINRKQRRSTGSKEKRITKKNSQLQEQQEVKLPQIATAPTAEEINQLMTLFQQQRYSETEKLARKITLDFPLHGPAWKALGTTLIVQKHPREALQYLYKAAKLIPNDPGIPYNLGIANKDLGCLKEAEACFLHALELKPNYLEAYNNLGSTLKELGRLDEAQACYRRALEIKPDNFVIFSNLLFNMGYSSRHSTSHNLAQAQKYGQIVSQIAGTHFSLWGCNPRPKRLRVGVVSGDLNIHPVGYFLESVLSQIDQSRIELIAYPTDNKTDELTERIRPYFSAWKSLVGQSDKEAALAIHDDGIHLLLDISGHMAKNRLPIFAWKPAPVQASWMGFLGTTGVQEIDYVIGDPIATPPEDEGNFSEKVWRLPEVYCCFTPPDFEVEVGPLPALTAGHVTFGCFNHLSKMTDEVVALWARVLKAVPDSRLFLKTRQLDDTSVCETTRKRFAAQGIDSSRLLLEGASPRADLLAAYQRVDIALDPFPYNGGTSNMESLWMAVPFITRRGDRFLSRCGQSIAANAGLADWIAEGDEDYIAKAQKHAANLEGLAALRSQLRQQVLASPLYDAPRFAKHFEDALWGMWKEHARKTGSRKK